MFAQGPGHSLITTLLSGCGLSARVLKSAPGALGSPRSLFKSLEIRVPWLSYLRWRKNQTDCINIGLLYMLVFLAGLGSAAVIFL